MYKFSALLILVLITACTEDKKTEQMIIPATQLQALEKAKTMESQLLEAQQNRDKQFKEQGL